MSAYWFFISFFNAIRLAPFALLNFSIVLIIISLYVKPEEEEEEELLEARTLDFDLILALADAVATSALVLGLALVALVLALSSVSVLVVLAFARVVEAVEEFFFEEAVAVAFLCPGLVTFETFDPAADGEGEADFFLASLTVPEGPLGSSNSPDATPFFRAWLK